MIETWIWRSNVDAFIDEVQNLSGERLDEGLEKVLRDDIDGSNADVSPPRWAFAEFDGPRPIKIWLGIDQGTEVLQVRLDLPDELEARARAILDVMTSYQLVTRSRL